MDIKNWVVGTDYPHADTMGSWPNTVPVINAREDLSAQAKEGILGQNALRLFGLAAEFEGDRNGYSRIEKRILLCQHARRSRRAIGAIGRPLGQ